VTLAVTGPLGILVVRQITPSGVAR
jgi:hypothetical protein